MPPEGERRLAAIMFTDVVGFTRQAQANEALALELLEEQRRLVRPILSRHGGREVKTIGDAFLVEFRSALDAVTCAVDVQTKMAERNASVLPSKRVELRVGVHLGDVVSEGGDIYGDAVNVSSRIEPLAEPGGVCISQMVYDNIRNKTDLQFSKMGDIELKNVQLPVGVYRIAMGGSTSSEAVHAPRERLAVLPFVNISPDPNDEYFADGLTEELISKLSEVGSLKVIARTSVMNYKKKEKKVSDIARELGVGSIIEGSVRKAGNKIRVTVQLIDASTEEHLWASNYDNQLDDIFAIQSDVASKVAGSISKGVLSKAEAKDTDDIEAYTLYIRAIQRQHEDTETSLREAKDLFEGAVARDPKFLKAHAGLAKLWCEMAANGYENFDTVSMLAEKSAERALEIAPDSAEANVAMAVVDGMLDRFDDGLRHCQAAIRVNPNMADTYIEMGILTSSKGDVKTGLASFRKAYELDPMSVRTANFTSTLCRFTGLVDESIAILERVKTLFPSNPRVLVGLAESYMLKGEHDTAQKYLDETLRTSPNEPIALLDQAILYANTGRKEKALNVLTGIEHDQKESVGVFGRLFIYSALGEMDKAYEALWKAAEMHSWPFLIKTLPVFEGLRKDPRFPRFCAQVGI